MPSRAYPFPAAYYAHFLIRFACAELYEWLWAHVRSPRVLSGGAWKCRLSRTCLFPLSVPLFYLYHFSSLSPSLSSPPFPCFLNCLFLVVKKTLHTQKARRFAFNGAVKRRMRCRSCCKKRQQRDTAVDATAEWKGNGGGGCGRLTWRFNWGADCICLASLTVLCRMLWQRVTLHLVCNAGQIPKVATCHADFCGTCRDLWQINC